MSPLGSGMRSRVFFVLVRSSASPLAATVDSRATLDAARAALDGQLAGARKDEQAALEEHEALLREARDLLAQGGPFDPELLKLKDQLGAELVAASFEDVGLDAAGRVEARLGPLVQALVGRCFRASGAFRRSQVRAAWTDVSVTT